MKPGEEKILNSHDSLLRYLLRSASQPAHIGPIGRHWLAWNSKSHRGNWFLKSIFGFYNKTLWFERQNEDDAFFFHLKLKSQRVIFSINSFCPSQSFGFEFRFYFEKSNIFSSSSRIAPFTMLNQLNKCYLFDWTNIKFLTQDWIKVNKKYQRSKFKAPFQPFLAGT